MGSRDGEASCQSVQYPLLPTRERWRTWCDIDHLSDVRGRASAEHEFRLIRKAVVTTTIDSTAIQLRFDSRSTPVRVQLDRATTIRRHSLQPKGTEA